MERSSASGQNGRGDCLPRLITIVRDAVRIISSADLKFAGGCRQTRKSFNRLQGADLHDPVLLSTCGQLV